MSESTPPKGFETYKYNSYKDECTCVCVWSAGWDSQRWEILSSSAHIWCIFDLPFKRDLLRLDSDRSSNLFRNREKSPSGLWWTHSSFEGIERSILSYGSSCFSLCWFVSDFDFSPPFSRIPRRHNFLIKMAYFLACRVTLSSFLVKASKIFSSITSIFFIIICETVFCYLWNMIHEYSSVTLADLFSIEKSLN